MRISDWSSDVCSSDLPRSRRCLQNNGLIGSMRRTLINATETAIRAVDAARFFKTERGFHGRFYCALQEQLGQAGLMVNGAILEMEYQKSTRHDLSQRPDIVLNIPAEHSGEAVQEI